MTALTVLPSVPSPSFLTFHSSATGPQADARFFQFAYPQSNTRRAYQEAVRQFSAFCAEVGIVDLAQVEPIHVAAFVEYSSSCTPDLR